MYQSTNFIGSYTPYDIMIKILDQNGLVSFSFSVCNFSSSSISNNKLLISLKNSKIIELEFLSYTDVQTALSNLKIVTNLLRNNCKEEQLQKNNPGAYFQGNELIKISLVSDNFGNLTINWVYDNDATYDIEYNIYGDFFSLKRIKNISGGTYELENLLPNQIYDFKIKRNV